jgi:hypothetical protein
MNRDFLKASNLPSGFGGYFSETFRTSMQQAGLYLRQVCLDNMGRSL